MISFNSQSQTWNTKEWLKLGRYHKTIWGGHKSEADGFGFFTHPQGRYRPDLEYESLVKSLEQIPSGDPNDHPICKFPARTDFILRHNPHIKNQHLNCEKFNKFKDRVSAKSVSLVFSSYYLNNPASSFGHTFIRLGKNQYHKNRDAISSELLDTGINYGASTGDANALTYIVGAFVGYFYGTYNAIPYYYKVREYNDFESRDLWTYHLDFTQSEIDQLVRHIWELGHADFRYYFLTENCSYHALTMLETIRPDLELVKYLPRNYIIPSDTLRAVVHQGIVKEVTYRPSASTYFYRHLNELTENDKALMKSVILGQELPSNLSVEKKAFIYDSAIGFIDYKYAKEILQEDPKAIELKRPVLIARSQVPIRSPELNFTKISNEKPHEGHSSGRFFAGGSIADNDKLFNLGYRFSFHDFLDYQKSYLPNSRVEMVSFRSVTDGKEFALTDISLADYFSVGAFDEYTKSFSWKLKFGQWQTYQKGVNGYSTQGAIAGYGYSYSTKYFTPFVLASLETSFVSEQYHKAKISYGADLGFLIQFSDYLRLSSLYEVRAYPWEENFLKSEIRWANVNHALGVFHNSQTKLGFSEIGINYMIYLK